MGTIYAGLTLEPNPEVLGEQGALADSVCLQATCGTEGQTDRRLEISLLVGLPVRLSLQQGTGQKC